MLPGFAPDSKIRMLTQLKDSACLLYTSHLFALLEMAARRGLSRVYVHCFLDGRDVPPASGRAYVEQLVEKCRALGKMCIRDRQYPETWP